MVQGFRPYVCPFVHPPISSFVPRSVHPSVRPSVHPPVCWSVRPSARLFVRSFIRLSVGPGGWKDGRTDRPSFHPPVCPSARSSTHSSVHSSVSSSVHPSLEADRLCIGPVGRQHHLTCSLVSELANKSQRPGAAGRPARRASVRLASRRQGGAACIQRPIRSRLQLAWIVMDQLG